MSKMIFKGNLITGDFQDKTMTFEIEGEMTLQGGNYTILPTQMYEELVNGAKSEKEALHIDSVMPRLLMEEQLHLKTGSRTLNVRGVKNMDMPHVIISCIEEWQPDSDDGFGDAEIDDASYYLTTKEIDMLIDKLREGKAFLNGA